MKGHLGGVQLGVTTSSAVANILTQASDMCQKKREPTPEKNRSKFRSPKNQ